MSHFQCSKCGKTKYDAFDHHERFLHHHNQFHDHHHEFNNHEDFFCDRFLCDKDFRLRLGGLQGGLNFRLRQLIGCVVKMELEGNRMVKARICFVGSDFVEIEVLKEFKDQEEDEKKEKKKKKRKKRKFNGKAMIVPFESIGFVELDDHVDKHDLHY